MRQAKCLALAVALVPAASFAQTYTCGRGDHALTATTLYSATQAGFDLSARPARIDSSGCSSSQPFFVSFPVAEGNYLVEVELGGAQAAKTTVRGESRRLMLPPVKTSAGKYRREAFVINVRRPGIAGGDTEVKRKPREIRSLDWDSKLTLGFSGPNAGVRTIRISPAPAKTVTVYLAGDSTVVDQENEPWAAWGQMLPAFFGPHVAISNNAESGETIASFESEQRFAKILSVIKPGDYLFFQFAHNDQKPGKGNVPPEKYTAMLQHYIAAARAHGATPVLVTSMNRRTFATDGSITDTLAPYPQTMRNVASAEHVALIDLNAMSAELYQAVGEPHSRELFVYAAPNTYPGQTDALHDDTHFNTFGAYELARCVVLGIQQSELPLKRELRAPTLRFDPKHPDDPAQVTPPAMPFTDTETPYER